MHINRALEKISLTKKTKDPTLVLAEYELEYIPEEIKELYWLKDLFLGFNSLTDITFLKHLPGLEKLDLRGNKIIDITPVSELSDLQFLDLDNNFITDITALQNKKSLTKLFLSNNKIKNLIDLKELTRLTILDLNNNNIEDISPLSFNKNVELLNLSKNRIVDISPLKELHKLKHLYIGSNLIKDLSALSKNLRNGLVLSYGIDLNEKASNNPLTTPPPEIVSQGEKSITRYFDEIEKQGSDRIYEAKLLIIGEGGAGKTSLARKIQNKEYNLPTESETTFGIDIIRSPLMKISDGKTFYLNIWDFGGQEIYHSTHQFFLTNRSLYVLLDDTRKDDKHVNDSVFSYWLQVIELLGGDSPLIIVQNEKGDRSKEIDLKSMQARFSFIKECKPTNLLTNRGLDDIIKSIKYWGNQLPHIGETLPKQWIEIRKQIEILSKTENHITIQEYLKLCAQYKIPEEKRALNLSSYLHDIGIFLHYQTDKVLKNIIILKNSWATEAVYKIMDDEQIKRNQGFFTEEDLNRLWFSDQYKYYHPTLIALIEKFELCYRISENVSEEKWLAPQLLSIASSVYEWDYTDNIQIRYVYDFMPKGLLSRLVVRLNRYLKSFDLAWRNGIVLHRNQAMALVKEIYASRIITINVRGPFAKEFMTIISEELDSLNATFLNLKVKKLIPCNCLTCANAESPHYYSYENLQNRIINGKTTAECEISYKAVNVKSLIDDVLAVVLRKRNEDMMVFISYAHKNEESKEELITHLKGLKVHHNIRTWDDRDIKPGEDWNEKIRENIRTADIILLLISAHYLASSYIWEEELSVAIERDKNGEAIVIPIFVEACEISGMPFMKLQGLPLNARPISSFRDKAEAFTEITRGIKKRLNKIEKN